MSPDFIDSQKDGSLLEEERKAPTRRGQSANACCSWPIAPRSRFCCWSSLLAVCLVLMFPLLLGQWLPFSTFSDSWTVSRFSTTPPLSMPHTDVRTNGCGPQSKLPCSACPLCSEGERDRSTAKYSAAPNGPLDTSTTPCAQFVFDQSGIISVPPATLLVPGRLLEVCYSGWPQIYWIAIIHGVDDKEGITILPVYRPLAVAGPLDRVGETPPSCGFFVLPHPSSYTLTVYQPQLLPSVEDDVEPFICNALTHTGRDSYSHHESLHRTLRLCGWTPEDELPRQLAVVLHPPKSLRRESSVLASVNFTTPQPRGIPPMLGSVEKELYKRVFSLASSNVPFNVGYWYISRGIRPDERRSPGSPLYQPQPTGCPETFKATAGHQSSCNNSAPSYQWHPTFGSRSNRLLSPLALS